MKQYIDKSALVAEIERITDVQQEICKADVALGKAPDSKNIEVIYQFQQFTKFLDTLEVKEIGVDIDSPEGDYNSKTVQFIDADGNIKEIKFNKAQNGKSALEAIKEEKVDNANKIEPKFKVGDWVVCGKLVTQITSIENDGYTNSDQGFISFEMAKKFHLWTIQDAKDGDVLAVEPIEGHPSSFVAIYKKQNGEDFDSYCFVGFDGKFYKGENGHSTEEIHPATKEQRDLLFQKMKEAGYEWDAEKKELKKIHIIDEGKAEMDYCFSKMMNGEKVGPAWSEEDEPQKELAETYLAVFDKKFPILPTLKGKQLADYKNFLNKCQQILGLKYWGLRPLQAKLFGKLSLLWAAWGAEHLKGLGQTDGDTDNEKQEWSEEDELKRSTLIHVVKKQKGSAIFEGLLPEELINWLKCIKQRIGG